MSWLLGLSPYETVVAAPAAFLVGFALGIVAAHRYHVTRVDDKPLP